MQECCHYFSYGNYVMNFFSPMFKLFITLFLIHFSASTYSNSCQDLVPRHHGDSNRVSSSGELRPNYPSWKLFDDNNRSTWISELWETPAWVEYQFPEPTVVNRYSIHYSNGSIRSRAPKVFRLQGLNSANRWSTLDTRSTEVNWAGSEKRVYDINNTRAYSQYRLYITDDNDRRSNIVVISMGELTLEHCSGLNANHLIGQWHQDRNQSSSGIEHYVPTDVDLGFSRFRNKINLHSGSVAEVFRRAPNGVHYFATGNWYVSGDTLTITFIDNSQWHSNRRFVYRYKISNANRNNMRLEVLIKYPLIEAEN